MAEIVRIRTTQNVEIEYQIASLGERIIASLIDGSLFVAYGLMLSYSADFINFTPAKIIIAILPIVFYHFYMELYNNGKSVGKQVMKIKVIRLDGQKPSIGDYAIRWLLRMLEVSITGGGLAVIVYLASGKGQRLGDMAAGTCVSRISSGTAIKRTLYAQTKDDYEVTYPNVEMLSAEDISVIKQAIRLKREYKSVESLEMLEEVKIKVQQTLIIPFQVADTEKFLITVVKDYNHIAGKEMQVS